MGNDASHSDRESDVRTTHWDRSVNHSMPLDASGAMPLLVVRQCPQSAVGISAARPVDVLSAMRSEFLQRMTSGEIFETYQDVTLVGPVGTRTLDRRIKSLRFFNEINWL